MTAEYVTTTAWAYEPPFPIWMAFLFFLLGGVLFVAGILLSDDPVPFVAGVAFLTVGCILLSVSTTGDQKFDEGVLYRDLQAQTGIQLLHQLGDTNGFIGELDGETITFSMQEVSGDKYLLIHEGPVAETTTEGD